MKRAWHNVDSSDRLSAIVLGACVLCLIALVFFR
jgi:hypothetical protein